MTIDLPDLELGSLKASSAELKMDFGVGLYTGRRASLGKAARIAGVSYTEFLHELGRRGISINYTVEDFDNDLKLLDAKLNS